MDKLAYMTPPYESEIRTQIVSVLGGALGQTPEAARIRLPAKMAHASFRPPMGADVDALAALDFGALYGAPLVDSVRVVNGWLLFDFSPAFFSAMVDEINCSSPRRTQPTKPTRKTACGCSRGKKERVVPGHHAFHRALVLALVAHESPTAYRKAEHAAKTLFHTIAAGTARAFLPLRCAGRRTLAAVIPRSLKPVHFLIWHPTKFKTFADETKDAFIEI